MDARFERYTDVEGEFRFRFSGSRDDLILRSEGYSSRGARETGIRSVKANALHDRAYVEETASDGRYYFNLRARNDETIATSVPYDRVADRQSAIDDVKAYAPTALVHDR